MEDLHPIRRPTYVAISPRMVVQTTAIVLLMVAGTDLLGRLKGVFVTVLVSAFIAVAVDPVVRLVQRTGVRRGSAVGIVLVGFFSVLTALGIALGNVMLRQSEQLATSAPGYLRHITASDTMRHLERRYHLVDRAATQLQDLPVHFAQAVPDIAAAIAGAVLLLVTMVALVTFLLLDGEQVARGVVMVFPRLASENRWAYVRITYRNVSRYVAGVTLECLINALALGIAMSVLRVPFALPMAMLVFVLNYIPKVGSFLGMLPAIGIAFAAVGNWTGVFMLVFVLVFQQLDGSFIYPAIMGRVINLSPMFVLLAALVGAQLIGVVGAVIAIPTAAVAHVALREYFRARDGGHLPELPPLHVTDRDGDGHADQPDTFVN